ncbi:MAG: RDD family protein [Microbacterium arborescens]
MIWEIDDRARTIEGLDADGRPQPEYAASLGLIRAPFGRRVLATVVEALVVALVQVPMLIVLPVLLSIGLADDPIAALTARDDLVLLLVLAAISSALSTAFIIVQLILLGRRGVTLGKAVTGLRAVNVRTLERPGFWRGAVVRYLVMVASFALPVIGPLLVIALSPFFDPARRGRSWPDLAAAIWLVDVRRGLNPYDDKRMRIARKTVATDLLDVQAELPSLATPLAATGSGAYVPLARNKGGVLGAVRSAPGSGVIGETEDAPADEPRPGIPTTVAPAPFVATASAPAASEPAARPAQPPVPSGAPSAGAAAPGAVVAPGPGAASWTPPPLLGDDAVAPSRADASEPAAAPAAPSASAAASAPASAAPHASAPAASATPAPDARPASIPEASVAPARASVVELVLDSGDTIPVAGGGVVLGRAPSTGPDDVDVSPVPVVDPTRSISKTHWALLRGGGRVLAAERGSTNGSVLVRAGAEQPIAPGHPVELRDGDTIRFGDRHAVVAIR